MEKYANKGSIVKNEVYDLFKDLIICPICDSLMIEPVICLNCQNSFCKKCIRALDDNCPLKCSNSNFKDVNDKDNFISKCKFKCINNCGKDILFNNLKNHYENCNPNNKNKIRALSRNQFEENNYEGIQIKSN